MIQDVIIIKDGLPLLSKSFGMSTSAFTRADNLIMVSGFFSAIESFSEQFEDLGTVSELKLAENNLRLSFLRDPSLPNLVYLASFNEESKGVNVQRFLRKISQNFLKLYNREQILNWRGKKNAFESFEHFISQYAQEEEEESEADFKGKVIDLFQNVQTHIEDDPNPIQGNEELIQDGQSTEEKKEKIEQPFYYDYIPSSLLAKDINPRFYLTGEKSVKIFKKIDGNKSIKDIAELIHLPEEDVFNTCKNLIKMGFISFN